ncbi:FtsW/RodA/SpoVE family cell cycle protein [Pedobacter sp.]|nr:FtsW/RodA/SpoVE family cell cycle protein [Candidatus Saccharibacteria bacterium]
MSPRRRVVGATRTASQSVGEFVRRHRPDYQLILFMGILVLIGLVVLFAISPARVELINGEGNNLDQSHFMQKQVLYLLAGLSAFIFAASVPLKLWQRNSSKLLLGAFGLCALLAFLGLFMDGGIILKAGGATRWFNLGPITFQPAELLKFALLIFSAGFIGRRITQGKVNSLSDTLVPMGLVIGLAIVFVIGFQKDMGTGITMLGMLAAMLFVAGLNRRMLVTAVGAIGIIGVAFTIFSPHRIARITTFFNPAAASEASNYHIQMANIAIGSGGFGGKGLGESIQAFGYLPEAVNDSIFAILGETFGFVGLFVILAIFFALLIRILKIMDHVEDPTMKLLVAGAFGWIGTHVVVNVGAMIGVLPLTGVTLPFLSFGGTSLLFTMLVLGLVFHVSRYTTHQKSHKGDDNENSHSRRGVGRTRHASTRRNQRA